jgi:hypothetical protein
VPKSSKRSDLAAKLNEDLAREYQAIIAYVVYSQMLKGAEYMAIAKEAGDATLARNWRTRSRSPSTSTIWAAHRP